MGKLKYDDKKELYFDYLVELRESGETNMFGAGEYLEFEFGLEKDEATQVLTDWMKSFETKEVDDTEVDDTEVDDTEVGDTEVDTPRFDDSEFVQVEVGDLSVMEVEFESETYAYHKTHKEYFKCKKTTAKRVYFDNEPKKFAPLTHIECFYVKR